jgi:hypothetical protein
VKDLVFLHGANHGSWCWAPLLAELQRTPAVYGRLIALDVPGAGTKRGRDASHETIASMPSTRRRSRCTNSWRHSLGADLISARMLRRQPGVQTLSVQIEIHGQEGYGVSALQLPTLRRGLALHQAIEFVADSGDPVGAGVLQAGRNRHVGVDQSMQLDGQLLHAAHLTVMGQVGRIGLQRGNSFNGVVQCGRIKLAGGGGREDEAAASRIELPARRGNARAVQVQEMLGKLDDYMAAIQVAITVVSLGSDTSVLGRLGAYSVRRLKLAPGLGVARSDHPRGLERAPLLYELRRALRVPRPLSRGSRRARRCRLNGWPSS